jgi:hypothetical protein
MALTSPALLRIVERFVDQLLNQRDL